MPPINTIKNRFLILAPAIPAAIWGKFASIEPTLPNTLVALLTAGAIGIIVIEVEYFLRKNK